MQNNKRYNTPEKKKIDFVPPYILIIHSLINHMTTGLCYIPSVDMSRPVSVH